MDLTANWDDRSGPILGQEVTPGCLCGKHVSRTFFSGQPRAGREKVPCPAFHLSGLLLCQMTLFPPMSLASADSSGRFAQEQSLHEDHSWRSTRGELGSPGRSCQGGVAPGLVMEVFSWPCVLVKDAAPCWVLWSSDASSGNFHVSRCWGGEVKVKGLDFQVLTLLCL